MRAVFGVSERGPLHDLLRDLLSATDLARAAVLGAVRPPEAAGAAARDGGGASTRGCWTRSPRAAPTAGHGHLLAARAGALRGRLGDERPRGPRPADDAAAGRARDDRHRPGVDARPADPQPGRAARARRPAATSTCARSSPSRCGCARSSRSPAAGSSPTSTPTASTSPPAPTSPPRSGSPTPARRPTRTRTRSAPSASSTSRRRPTPGSPTAAASAAASAPPSPRWRCASCSARSCAASTCAPPPRRAERVARRNVTFSPRHGTRVIATRRR